MPARMHDQLGKKALHVMALPADEGWMYFAEVVERQAFGEVRTRAVSPKPLPSEVSALARGMAYARWLAAGDEVAGYDAETLVWGELQST